MASLFERLNAMLRGDSDGDDKLKKCTNTISGALKKYKLDYDVIAYRGMNFDPSGRLAEGDLYRQKQFFSTSVIEKKSFIAKYKIVIYVKKDRVPLIWKSLATLKTNESFSLTKIAYIG